MRRENKKFWSNGHTFLIYFSILFTLVAFSSAEATTSVTLTPDSLSADDPGMTELTADIASPGNTVWVDIFIDADKDGIIDPEEAKVMSFSLTDGTGSPEIAGVTNTNVNGDEDGTVNSSVTTTLKFYDPPNPAGQFIIQVTDEDSSHAEAIFTFTQAATSQSISGTVTCDGSPVAGASVYIESFDDDDCDVGAAITDQDGNYQIYLEDPGTYSVDVDAQGYLGKDDGGSELDGIIVDGHETGKDLKLFNGNRHITGTIKDKDTDQGIGGVWVEAEIENGIEYWSEAITDHDGSFDIVVIDGTWELEVADGDLQAKGYVGTDLDDIIVAGFDVPDQDVSLPPATALITGSVEDQSHNPVSACVGAETEIEGVEYWSETVTDPSGNYILGVIAENWEVEAEPLCEPYLIEPPEQYISIADSQVKTLDFICAPAGAISGNVRDSNNQPIEGLWVHAFDNACGGNWLGGDYTDKNGNYTICGLPAGDCYVQTCARCDGLNYVDEWWDSADGTIDCNQAASVNVVTGQNTGNINFALEPGGSVSGTVTDSQGNPIPNIHVYAQAETCGGNWLGGTNTDINGNYTLAGLPVGNAYISTCAHCSGLNYVDEWWDNNSGTTDCNEAAPVSVPLNSTHEDINFTLRTLPLSIGLKDIESWPLLLGVQTCHDDSGYYIRFRIKVVDGYGVPDDIDTVQVIYPNDTTIVNLDLHHTSGYYKGIYHKSINVGTALDDANSNIQEGIYTFVVTDKHGGTATARDYLHKNILSDLPGNFSPDGVTTENCIPTLSWDAVSDAEFYMVIIAKSGVGKVYSAITDTNSFTVPAGILEPNTAYYWLVAALREKEGWDIDNACKAHADMADNPQFTTPDCPTPPAIDLKELRGGPDMGVFTYNTLAGTATIFGHVVRDANGVPGDIDSVVITGPGGTYTLNYIGSKWPNEGIYMYAVSGSLANGLYTFTVTDNGGLTAQATDNLTVNILDPPDGSSFNPADGATDVGITPTLSWDAVTGAAGYRLEIYDDVGDVVGIYFLTTNSFTLPEDILSYSSTYRWTIFPGDNATDTDNSSGLFESPHEEYYHQFTTVGPTGPGDANGDGSTNVQDVICIINVILDTGTASGNPDCNEDGSVNVQDVICVINKILEG